MPKRPLRLIMLLWEYVLWSETLSIKNNSKTLCSIITEMNVNEKKANKTFQLIFDFFIQKDKYIINPIETKNRFPNIKEEKRGNKQMINHEKNLFFFLIKFKKLQISKGWPAIVKAPDGQKGTKEKVNAK